MAAAGPEDIRPRGVPPPARVRREKRPPAVPGVAAPAGPGPDGPVVPAPAPPPRCPPAAGAGTEANGQALRLVASRPMWDGGVLVQRSPSLAGLHPPLALRVNPDDLARLGDGQWSRWARSG